MHGKSRDSLIGALFVLGAITVWGLYFPYAIISLQSLTDPQFLALRWGFGAVTLYVLNRSLKRSIRIQRRDWPVVIAAVVIGIIAHQMIQVHGLRQTSATNTGWILTLIPPLTGVLGWVFLRERVRWRQIIGLFIAMAGVLLFVSKGYIRQLSFINNFGDFLVLISVFTWSGYTILAKSRLRQYDPLPLTLVFIAIGFLFFLSQALLESGLTVPPLDTRGWVIMILIGAFPSGLAYYWWNAGLKRLSAINTSMFLFIEAIVASVAGAILLGERFTLPMVGFAIITVIGVTISQGRMRWPATTTKPSPPSG
jgi:drug/metabolite transporter (DMT)-like permease